MSQNKGGWNGKADWDNNNNKGAHSSEHRRVSRCLAKVGFGPSLQLQPFPSKSGTQNRIQLTKKRIYIFLSSISKYPSSSSIRAKINIFGEAIKFVYCFSLGINLLCISPIFFFYSRQFKGRIWRMKKIAGWAIQLFKQLLFLTVIFCFVPRCDRLRKDDGYVSLLLCVLQI